MEPLSISSIPICPYRVPRVGYWLFPCVSVCPIIIDSKKDLPQNVSRALFLEHSTDYVNSIPVFTDELDLLWFSPISVMEVVFLLLLQFTAELSAVNIVLQTIITLLVKSFLFFF